MALLSFKENRHRLWQKNSFIGAYLALILCLSVYLLPTNAFAHAYSSSYTEINFTDEKTEFIFSIDTLSILELVEDIDENNNGILDESEVKEEEFHLGELLHYTLVIDKENQQQEGELVEWKIEKKDNKEYITFSFLYPPFYPGDTISFEDGFFFKDEDSNYINLISANNRGETSQAVLQGDNRTWTILLTELQMEQGVDGTNSEITQHEQEQNPPQVQDIKPNTSNNSWYSFMKLGMLHILTGYDHLLFLLALLLRKQTFKQYAAIVTSFTIAHSITISLAVLDIVDLPSRFVEAMIAFSICYVAAENLFRKEIRYRWGLTFLFGLIHGLGFANILQEMNIPKSHLVQSLLSFNIGIEIVQLIIVLILLPLLTYIHKLSISQKILQYGSILIILLGGFWLVERIFF